jgi:Flp pilus assembly protein TadD
MNVTDWTKASAELESLLKKGSDVHLRDLLAAVYYRDGRVAEAQKLAVQLIKEEPQDTDARMLKGAIHLDKREYTPASQEFDQVLHFTPDSAPALYFLALASYGEGKEQLAQQQMERSLNLKKELLPARVWLIDFNLKRGSSSVALDLARSAPGRQEYAPEIVILRALCEPLTPLDSEQQKSLLRALLLRPQFITEYQNLGMFTLLRKYGNPFREPLEKVAKKRPELLSVERLLTTILEAQGKQDEVLAQVQKKLAANPNSPMVLLALAKLQMGRGELKGARINLERALAFTPDDPALLARMAELEVTEISPPP